MFSHRHAESELSVIVFRQGCPSNSYILEENSRGRTVVEIASGSASYKQMSTRGATKSLVRQAVKNDRSECNFCGVV